jgi:hypothetical protein
MRRAYEMPWMLVTAEAAPAQEAMLTEKAEGIVIAFQFRLKHMTSRGAGKTDCSHAQLLVV